MQVYCKQVVDDAAPGVQLLRLVGNVCDAVEQVERVLAVVGDGVEVDVLQGLAHLHQQLGLAHACAHYVCDRTSQRAKLAYKLSIGYRQTEK
eukprot:1158163-Pelagomonas_calceolata.AAC.14